MMCSYWGWEVKNTRRKKNRVIEFMTKSVRTAGFGMEYILGYGEDRLRSFFQSFMILKVMADSCSPIKDGLNFP